MAPGGAGAKARNRRRGGGPVERYLPLAYMVMAVLVIVVLLPSALRPPAQQSTQTAQFSPNAPHQNQQSIIAAFQQASSGTAGAGTGNGTGPGTTGSGPAGLQLPPSKLVPNFCPNGFGVPPRQTADIYAGPCAGAWKGDNGGATWRGVTGTTIRICVTGTGSGNQPSANGPVASQESASQSAWDRTFTVFQQYFNRNFQFYGRQVQFIVENPSGSGISAEQTAGVACDQTWGVFAAGPVSDPECTYLGQHSIVAFCGDHWPVSFYQDGAPDLYGWVMDGDELVRLSAEFICKDLAGHPAQWAGEADYQHTTRKFGMLLYDTRGYQQLGPETQSLLKSECGQNLDIVYSDLDNSNGEASLAQAVTKFKQDGVTTVIPGVDYISSAVFTNQAANQAWFPEILVTDGGDLGRNQLASLQNQTEWAHAFGITDLDMERPLEDTDCYRAYQSVDPANSPAFVFCDYLYDSLYMLMTGIQNAGPHLTPTTFQQGLYKLGFRYPDRPAWAIGGGYGPGHPAYADNIAEVWWNSTAPSPDPNTYGAGSDNVGAYEYLRNGQRYRLGQIPVETPAMFSSGTTTAPDPTQYGD